MDVLKKIKASTLVETIVASVIIVLIFGIATLVLNNIYKSTLITDRSMQDYELNKLRYQYKNHVIKVPSVQEFEGFDISMEEENEFIFFNIVKNGKVLRTKSIFRKNE